MSHITDVKMRIRDLDLAAEVAKPFGFELRRDRKECAFWGEFVGDSSSYGEFNPHDFKNCDATIGRIGKTPTMGPNGEWEVALKKAPDGDGYIVGYDTYGGGGATISNALGFGLEKFKRAYGEALAKKKLAQRLSLQGFTLDNTKTLADGRQVIRAWKF
jgi:hypothetical protein